MDMSKIKSFKLEKGKSYLIVAEEIHPEHLERFRDTLAEFFPGTAFLVTNNKLQIIEQKEVNDQ